MGLGRYLRTQWRDRKSTVIGAAVAGGIAGLGAAAIAVAGPVLAPTLLFTLLPLGMGYSFTEGRIRGNSLQFGNVNLTGDNRDLESIDKMTWFILDKVDGIRHLQDLPDSVERSLLRHLGDLVPILKRVRANDCMTGAAVPVSLVFKRPRIGADGRDEQVVLATVTPDAVIMAPRMVQIAAKTVQPEPQKALPAPSAMAHDFTRLSQDVRALQEKVAAIENPAPASLDKPAPDKRGI